MHIVTIVGNQYSGKTALCEQWTGSKFTDSYITTVQLTQYHLPLITLQDTPSLERFSFDIWNIYSDMMVLMANKDDDDEWYEKISELYPAIPWILILNGVGSFKRRRRWALEKDIRVFQLDLSTELNVAATLIALREYLDELPVDPDKLALQSLSEYMFQFIPLNCL